MIPILRSTAIAAALVLCAPVLAQNAPAPAAPAQAAAPSGDPVKGRDNSRMCEGCHEIPGWRTAFPEVYHVPKIVGQNEPYIVAALKAYRSGERTHPSMRGIAASLSDDDIANLATYYSRGLDTKTASK